MWQLPDCSRSNFALVPHIEFQQMLSKPCISFTTKLIGIVLAGPAASLEARLNPALEEFVNLEFWFPGKLGIAHQASNDAVVGVV